MRRLIVLCLIFLPLLSFPGDAGAIFGEVWSTDAYKSALDPSIGPPLTITGATAKPDATFNVESINFNSQAKNISFDEFLNSPDWTYLNPESKFDPKDKMFKDNGSGNGDEGIFFRFTWDLSLSEGSNPFTIVHDDGFVLYLSNGIRFDFSGQFGKPESSKVDLTVNNSENYTVTLDYGALNDTYSQVLIIRTPEPGSMLLLALGIIGIGILRRRH